VSDPAATAVADECRAWLAENWDPDLSLRAWRERLCDAGWATPTWPVAYGGRGLPASVAAVVDDELFRAGAVGTAAGVGMGLAAPTILEHGPDETRARFLRPIATGAETWCQLFSEPGSGSDLAGLTTRADRDGDEWVVSGQKVWNTSAHHADYGLLLARTNWDVPKHRGITCFALPMRQPGIEVRPLRQMNGYSSFNEVFMAEARVPAGHEIGAVDEGWRVALTTLTHERHSFAAFARRRVPAAPADGEPDRAVREAKAESDEWFSSYVWYPQRAGRPDLLVERARAAGRNADPVVRQRIAHVVTLQRVAEWSAARGRAAQALGRPPGAEGSIAKLVTTAIARASADAHSLIAGAAATLSGADGPAAGIVTEVLVSVPAISIAGGTDEVQHNIIGERVLGLPKEPSLDAELPFRDVPRNVR
jgi:alkylation response protein AidB-like acyl-CoA dehydrogenase